MGAAYTALPDGTVLRWHPPYMEECRANVCTLDHATKAELLAVDPDDAMAVGFEQGVAAAKGEL